jgi:hypothetical protein
MRATSDFEIENCKILGTALVLVPSAGQLLPETDSKPLLRPIVSYSHRYSGKFTPKLTNIPTDLSLHYHSTFLAR